MTKEKFTESLISSRFRECYSEDGYTLYERDGFYLFLYLGRVTDSPITPSWSLSYEDVKLTRSRVGYFEIEKMDGTSITFTKDDDIEIGCMG